MDFMAISQGLGLAIAVGIGGALTALFIAAMASLESGIDPEGTDYSFIGATWFLAILLAVVVLTVLARGREAARFPVVLFVAAVGAVACAASLAEEGDPPWLGLVLGAIVAGLTALLATDVLEGALRRARAVGGRRGGVGRDVDGGTPSEVDTANVLVLTFALAGMILALLALFVPPASLVVGVAVIALAIGRRRKSDEKYEGLRILR